MRMTRLTWVTAALVLGCGDPGPGGRPGTIEGRVWAPSVEGDSVPLAGANVLVTPVDCGPGALCAITAQTTTDSTGHYVLNVPSDRYGGVVNPPPGLALQSASMLLLVPAGDTLTWSVVLERVP